MSGVVSATSATTTAAPQYHTPKPSPRHSVLLVEDDQTIREVISELLEDEGYSVVSAEDGGKAIDLLRDHRPPPESLCLVILDMMLPVADGMQVLRALTSFGAYVPVVAMSADDGQLRRASQGGAEDTLAKPFDFEQLLAVVARNCSS
jgi:CheY-like chemotaxis protein